MGNDAVNDPLLLVLRHVVDAAGFMELGLAAMIAFVPIEHLVDTGCFFAARIFVLGAKRLGSHLDLGRRLVVATLAHLGNGIELCATVTFDQVQVGPHLPVDLFPGYAISFSDKCYELLKIPILIDHMLGSHLAVSVHEIRTFETWQYFTLLFREKLIAVSAFVEVILFLLEQELELLHEEATDDLVLALLEDIEAVQADFLSHLADDVRIDAGHVNLDSGNLLDVLADEIEALANQPIYFEKLGRDEDGDRVLDVELWPSVLHDRRVREVVFLAVLRAVAFLVVRLVSTLPSRRNAVANCTLKLFLISLLLLVLLHGEDVVEEPLEDDSVAVDGDVDLVVVRDFLQAPVEVFHILDQEAAGEGEVTLLVLAVIDHVDHDTVLEFEVLSLEHFEATLGRVAKALQTAGTARAGHLVRRGRRRLLARVVRLVVAADR